MLLRYSFIRYPPLIWVAAVCLLAGCTVQELRPPFSLPMVQKNHEVETKQAIGYEGLDKLASILFYEQFIHGLQEEELELERDLLETSLDTATDVALVKLALLYYHKNAPFHNSDRALSIFKSCMVENGGTSVEIRSFSTLIVELLVENTDQQRALKLLRNKLEKERNERIRLKEQIDALKAIEESINDRSNSLSGYINR